MITLLAQAAADPPKPAFPKGHPFSQMGEYWGTGGEVSWEWLLIGLGGVLVAMSLLSLRAWWRMRDQRPAPLLTFLQVCRLIDLPWADRWLLWRIARRQHLPSPLTLLLCPVTLRHHGRAYAETVGLANPAGRLRRVASLRRRLFGEDTAPSA